MSDRELGSAIDAAVRAVEHAIAKEMHTARGEPATPHLSRLRDYLLAMRSRGDVDSETLRTIIRHVADWAPEDDLSLLASLGAIARTRGPAAGPH